MKCFHVRKNVFGHLIRRAMQILTFCLLFFSFGVCVLSGLLSPFPSLFSTTTITIPTPTPDTAKRRSSARNSGDYSSPTVSSYSRARSSSGGTKMMVPPQAPTCHLHGYPHTCKHDPDSPSNNNLNLNNNSNSNHNVSVGGFQPALPNLRTTSATPSPGA